MGTVRDEIQATVERAKWNSSKLKLKFGTKIHC